MPSEFKIRRVYFRALKMVFKSSMLPLSIPSILADNNREKVTLEQGEVGEIADLRFLDVHASLGAFLLDGLRRTFLDLFANQLLGDQRVGGAGFNLKQ